MALTTLELTVNLSDKDRELMRELLEALRGSGASGILTGSVSAETVAESPKAEHPAAPDSFEPVSPAAELPVDPDPAPAKEYTLEEIRARVMALSRISADTKARVKTALNKYADSVPKLKKDDYAAFMADLDGLEG